MPYPVRMGAQPPGCTSHPVPWLHPFPSHPVPSPKSLWWALHAFLLVDPSVPQLPVMPTGGPAATRSPASLNGRPLLSVLSAPLPSRRGCSSHPRAWQALGSRFVPWELGLPLPSFSRTLFLPRGSPLTPCLARGVPLSTSPGSCQTPLVTQRKCSSRAETLQEVLA